MNNKEWLRESFFNLLVSALELLGAVFDCLAEAVHDKRGRKGK